jgi:hypothetical protein
MNLKNRKNRQERPKNSDTLTTIAGAKNVAIKQTSPTCYRFSDYDKAEIALAVSSIKTMTNTKVTPAKLLRSLVRLNNLGHVDIQKLINIIDSL